jgi:hypothetical protein
MGLLGRKKMTETKLTVYGPLKGPDEMFGWVSGKDGVGKLVINFDLTDRAQTEEDVEFEITIRQMPEKETK